MLVLPLVLGVGRRPEISPGVGGAVCVRRAGRLAMSLPYSSSPELQWLYRYRSHTRVGLAWIPNRGIILGDGKCYPRDRSAPT